VAYVYCGKLGPFLLSLHFLGFHVILLANVHSFLTQLEPSMPKQTPRKKTGRPQKSASGKRIVISVSLSPEGYGALKQLCERPIAPLPHSSVIEHLIMMHHGERAANRERGQ
jgi:hypothetical protein